MIRPRRLVDAAVWVVTFALAGVTSFLASRPVTHAIAIDRLAFRPPELRVARGDTVTWTNDDLVPHTVTAVDGRWDSGEIPPGGTFTIVVETTDSIPYDCRYHPVMIGELRPWR